MSCILPQTTAGRGRTNAAVDPTLPGNPPTAGVGRGTCQLVRLPLALAVLARGCCGRGGMRAPARSSDLLQTS